MPDLIKIDAESAEIQVLEGLARTLKEVRPIVTLEVGDYPHLIEAGVPSSASVLRAVMNHGYICHETGFDGCRRHHLREDDSYDYSNIIAVPAEREHEFA